MVQDVEGKVEDRYYIRKSIARLTLCAVCVTTLVCWLEDQLFSDEEYCKAYIVHYLC